MQNFKIHTLATKIFIKIKQNTLNLGKEQQHLLLNSRHNSGVVEKMNIVISRY
jgi:hypothetical protein